MKQNKKSFQFMLQFSSYLENHGKLFSSVKKTMFILPINFCVFPVSFQQYPFRGRITWPCVRSNVIITYAVVWRFISVMRSHIGQTNERLGLHLRKHYFLFDTPLWWGDLFCASGRYTFGSSYFPGGGQQIVVKKTPQVSDSRTTSAFLFLTAAQKRPGVLLLIVLCI